MEAKTTRFCLKPPRSRAGGGVTLAIDVTLRLIERLCGRDKAEETARIIEYSAAARGNEGRLAAMVIRTPSEAARDAGP